MTARWQMPSLAGFGYSQSRTEGLGRTARALASAARIGTALRALGRDVPPRGGSDLVDSGSPCALIFCGRPCARARCCASASSSRPWTPRGVLTRAAPRHELSNFGGRDGEPRWKASTTS